MASKVEDLEQLAETCIATAKVIKQYLASNNLPQPTFDQNGPSSFPKMSMQAELARTQLKEASKTLYELAAGPEEAPTQYFYNTIAQAVPLGTTISYTDLARATGTVQRQLKKMIRQLALINIFCEPQPGYVSHTASSKLLVTTPGVVGFNAYQVLDSLPVMLRQLDAIERWGHGDEEPTHTPVQLHYDSEKTVFGIYEERPDVLGRFSDLMRFASKIEGLSITHAVTGFPWSSLPPDALVVDIGGNIGHCCVAFAQTTPPTTKFVVQDLPQVIARATNPGTSAVPLNLRDRFHFLPHNYYEPQPAETCGADVYFLRMIMHNYSDKWCAKILRPIVDAMTPGRSRLVIMDQILPPAGVLPTVLERFMRTQDLMMTLLLNAVEREEQEWHALVQLVDPRLKITRIEQPVGSFMAVIEAMLVEGT